MNTVIYTQVKARSVKWRLRHIRGNQNKGPFKDLDQWVMLNVEMDHLVQGYLREVQETWEVNNSNRCIGKDGQFGYKAERWCLS